MSGKATRKAVQPGAGNRNLAEEAAQPVIADIAGIRLRLHARSIRGSMTLAEAARRANLSQNGLSRLEKGETTQVKFSTLAKLISLYGCALEDLIEVDRHPAEAPMYETALAAIADGTLAASGQQRRTVWRPGSLDVIAAGE